MTGVLHIVLARKPIEGTVAENCLRWGCGAINIDRCRIGIDDGTRNRPPSRPTATIFAQDKWTQDPANCRPFCAVGGRFPANFILDLEVARCLDLQSGNCGDHGTNMRGVKPTANSGNGMFSGGAKTDANCYHDSGGASRFFFNFTEQESDEW